jgi:hypothetical protein
MSSFSILTFNSNINHFFKINYSLKMIKKRVDKLQAPLLEQ